MTGAPATFDFAAAGAALGAEVARRALACVTAGDLSDCDAITIKNEMVARILAAETALHQQGVDDDQIAIFVNSAGQQVLRTFSQFRAAVTATEMQSKGH